MKSKSFTLIELLVVIVIIGILAGVIIVSVSSSINKANFAKAQSFSNTVQNELLGDLVSEWTFNSPAVSGKTEDSWGNNDGTLMGANGLPQIQTKENCVYGTCYLFDGEDDYIDCGDGVDTRFTNNITISAWIKPLGTNNYETVISRLDSIRLATKNDGTVLFYLYGIKLWLINGKTELYDGNWHYISATYNSNLSTNNMSLYIDGHLSSYYTATGSFNYVPGSINIGHYGPLYHSFKGLIDDVRIYNEALSSAQIKQQYVAGLNSLLAKGSISKEEYNDKIEILAQK